MPNKKVLKPDRRNKHYIGFDDSEWKEINSGAGKLGLYPRQYVMLKVKQGHAK